MTNDDALDFAALLDEIPRLSRMKRFGALLDNLRLFRRAGDPLSRAETQLARAFLDDLGFPDVEPALVESWSDAADAALSMDHDAAGWEAEALLRVSLTDDALSLVDEDGLAAVAAHVADRIGAIARPTSAQIASLFDIRDPGVLNAAVGGAAQAAHDAALAFLVADDDAEATQHPFVTRFRLFARGRWPIGVAGLTFNIL